MWEKALLVLGQHKGGAAKKDHFDEVGLTLKSMQKIVLNFPVLQVRDHMASSYEEISFTKLTDVVAYFRVTKNDHLQKSKIDDMAFGSLLLTK